MTLDGSESDLFSYIEKIRPNFEEFLIRAFKNETLAYHKQRTKEVQYFDDVLFSVGNTIIELRKLQLPWVPDFRINQLRAHLGTFCLDLNLNLGSLRIEGDYEANDALLQALLPVAHEGKITVTFRNMAAKGRVGLFIREDSLLPENYDLVYEAGGVDIMVNYFSQNASLVETKIQKDKVEETLGISMWNQLTQTLTELLNRQLRKVVSEFSIGVLFGDRMECLRSRERVLLQEADYVADSLLCAAKDYIVQRSCREVATPNMEAVFKGKLGSAYLGRVRTCRGYIKDLATLNRRCSWSCFEHESETIVFGSVYMSELKHGYRLYEAQYENIKVNGSLNLVMYDEPIFLKVVVRNKEPYLEKLQVAASPFMDIDVSGLASLEWLSSRMKSWAVATFQQKAIAELQRLLTNAFNEAIDKRSHNIIKNENIRKES